MLAFLCKNLDYKPQSIILICLKLFELIPPASLAFLLSSLRHAALKNFRRDFLCFLSVRIVSLVVFILLISKDFFPMCKFKAEIIALCSVSYLLFFAFSQISHTSLLYFFHFSGLPFRLKCCGRLQASVRLAHAPLEIW